MSEESLEILNLEPEGTQTTHTEENDLTTEATSIIENVIPQVVEEALETPDPSALDSITESNINFAGDEGDELIQVQSQHPVESAPSEYYYENIGNNEDVELSETVNHYENFEHNEKVDQPLSMEETLPEQSGYYEDAANQEDEIFLEDGASDSTATRRPSRYSVEGKLFIGGLAPMSSEADLKTTFEKFGKLIDCIVMRDSYTNRPRGFGFITFEDPRNVDKVLSAGKIEIDGRTIDAKAAIPRNEGKNPQDLKTKKVFVGGLGLTTTETNIKDYFSKFGAVQEVQLMHDGVTRRPRGFAFVTFGDEDTVEKVVQKPFHQIDSKQVEVKKAVPKVPAQVANNFQRRVDRHFTRDRSYYGGNYNDGYSDYGNNYGGGGRRGGGHEDYGYGGRRGQGGYDNYGDYGRGGRPSHRAGGGGYHGAAGRGGGGRRHAPPQRHTPYARPGINEGNYRDNYRDSGRGNYMEGGGATTGAGAPTWSGSNATPSAGNTSYSAYSNAPTATWNANYTNSAYANYSGAPGSAPGGANAYGAFNPYNTGGAVFNNGKRYEGYEGYYPVDYTSSAPDGQVRGANVTPAAAGATSGVGAYQTAKAPTATSDTTYTYGR
jgi:RNA recognition motif-containing protein